MFKLKCIVLVLLIQIIVCSYFKGKTIKVNEKGDISVGILTICEKELTQCGDIVIDKNSENICFNEDGSNMIGTGINYKQCLYKIKTTNINENVKDNCNNDCGINGIYKDLNDKISTNKNDIDLNKNSISSINTEMNNLKKDCGQVGDIKASILPLLKFQNLHGSGWVLMDGKTSLSGTKLGILTSLTTVPDARGRFFRMKDHQANINPNGDNQDIGSVHNDLTRFPRNSAFRTQNDGSHTHSIRDPSHNHPTPGYTNAFNGANNYPTYNGGYNERKVASSMSTTGISVLSTNSHHSHSITGGDQETIPKNIIMNYFIKIN